MCVCGVHMGGGAAFTPPRVTTHVCRLQIRGSPLCCCQLNLRGGEMEREREGEKVQRLSGVFVRGRKRSRS